MAKTKAQQDEPADRYGEPVDRHGEPLPLVVMVSKDGVEVPVRDAAGLSAMHYTNGMEFAEPGMTYVKALGLLLGADADRHLIQIPAESEPEDSGASSEPDGTTSD